MPPPLETPLTVYPPPRFSAGGVLQVRPHAEGHQWGQAWGSRSEGSGSGVQPWDQRYSIGAGCRISTKCRQVLPSAAKCRQVPPSVCKTFLELEKEIAFWTSFGVAFGRQGVPKVTPTYSDDDPVAMQASLRQASMRICVRYLIYYVFATFLWLPGNAVGTNLLKTSLPAPTFQ